MMTQQDIDRVTKTAAAVVFRQQLGTMPIDVGRAVKHAFDIHWSVDNSKENQEIIKKALTS